MDRSTSRGQRPHCKKRLDGSGDLGKRVQINRTLGNFTPEGRPISRLKELTRLSQEYGLDRFGD